MYQIYYIVEFNPIHHIWSDPQRHWEQGVESLRNDPMALTDPVMYQLYIGMLAKLSFKDPVLIAFYTSTLAIFNTWVWYRFIRELQSNKLIALGMWALISILPSWMAIYGYFMQETLLLPMLGSALYATWRCRRKRNVSSFLVMVVLWALAGLTRGMVIPLAAVACSWLWIVQKEKLQKSVYSVLILTFILGPLTYRSYQNMGIFAPHGVAGLVQVYNRSGKKQIKIYYDRDGAKWWYWFASPSTGEMPFEPLSKWTTQRQGVVEVHIDIAKGSMEWDKALAENPLSFRDYLWITKENIIYLFFGSSWPDKNLSRSLDRVNHYSRWMWAPLTLSMLVWTLLYWRKLKGSRLLFSMIFAWFVVQIAIPLSMNEGRYRKPYEGLLLAQLALLLDRRKRPVIEQIKDP